MYIRIALLLLLLLPVRVFAAVETYSERIEGASIVSGATFTVYDDKYYTMATTPLWVNQFTNYRVKNKVYLSINPEVLQVNALSGGVTVSVKTWTWNAGTASFVTATVSQTLSVSYDLNGVNIIDEVSGYVF